MSGVSSSTTNSPLRLTTVLLLAVGVMGVSLSGPLIAAAAAVPALAMSLWRSGLGAAALLPRGLTASRAELKELPRQDLVRSCFAGLLLACHFATWIESLMYTSVASSTALVCLQVAWVVLLARLSGVRAERRVWQGLALAFAGVLVVSGVDLSISTRALAGDGLALVGGVFAAGYVTVGGRVRERASTTAYALPCYATSAAVLLVACLLAGVQITGFPLRDWLLIIAVTLASQLLGHSVFNYLLATVSTTLVSLTILLEVPGAALLAGVLLGQTPPLTVYLGLALILCGLALVVSTRSAAAATGREAPVD
jgi:drug/metabolite transporter (DMT)-like permease